MFSEKFRAVGRHAVVNIILVSNAFVWYYFVIDILQNIVRTSHFDYFTSLLIWIAHFAGIAVSAIVGASLVNRIKEKNRFLSLWMILGIASSITTLIVDLTNIPNVLMVSLLLGASLGIGMPACMGYLTEKIEVQNRSRLGGIILLLSGIGIASLGTISVGRISLQGFILTVWRTMGLALFFLFKPQEQNVETKKAPSYRSLFNQRPFVLYLIPWVAFSLITYLTLPMQFNIVGKSMIDSLMVFGNVLTGVFAVVGGFLSDAVGRKRIAIAGFVLLGLGYSVLGIYPENPLSWYFYTVVDGIAWGMLFVIFVVTIWGDLSYEAPSDKHYAIGVLPFFISKFLQLTAGNELAASIPATSIFSLTAFFLFLAVLPLVYAPETLPEKTLKDRELKSYLEKARKVKEKYA